MEHPPTASEHRAASPAKAKTPRKARPILRTERDIDHYCRWYLTSACSKDERGNPLDWGRLIRRFEQRLLGIPAAALLMRLSRDFPALEAEIVAAHGAFDPFHNTRITSRDAAVLSAQLGPASFGIEEPQ